MIHHAHQCSLALKPYVFGKRWPDVHGMAGYKKAKTRYEFKSMEVSPRNLA